MMKGASYAIYEPELVEFLKVCVTHAIEQLALEQKMVRYTQLRWSTIFTENASDQLTLILRYYGVERTFETVMNVYQSQALDPHVNRERFRDEWWS